MFIDNLPEATAVRKVGHTFKHQRSGTVSQRSIEHITVTGYPAAIRSAPVHIFFSYIEHCFMSECGIDQITAAGVQHALGFAGRTGGVQNEQRIFGIHDFGYTALYLPVNQIGVPVITFIHGNCRTSAFDYQHMLDALRTGHGKCCIHIGLERNFPAAAYAFISRNDQARLAIHNPAGE